MSDRIKNNILKAINITLDEKIQLAKHTIESAKESRDNETKSSVGDKYETGRTLMQFEVEKNRAQLEKIKRLKSELSKIDLQKVFNRVEFGSVVTANKGIYFVSAGLGKVAVDNKQYYCISLASPLGKMLYDKNKGDQFQFNGTTFFIENIF